MMNFEEKQDFSAIDRTYILDREAYKLLKSNVSKSTINTLRKVKHEVYEDFTKFSQAMSNILTIETWQSHGKEICQAASIGRRKFYEKLGWLFTYRSEIQTYSALLTLIGLTHSFINNRDYLRWRSLP